MKEFIKDYILSQITPTIPSNAIQILNQTQEQGYSSGWFILETDKNIILYNNASSTIGMNFKIYDKNMNLVKTEYIANVYLFGELKQAEDGNFYLTSNYYTDQSTSYFSLILLNDIVHETATIRKWYNLAPYGISERSYFACQKRRGSADYLFSWIGTSNLYFTELNISVQNGNSVKKWVYQGYVGSQTGIIKYGYLYNQEASQVLVVRSGSFGTRTTLVNLEIDGVNEDTNIVSIANGKVTIDLVNSNVVSTGGLTANLIVNGIQSYTLIRDSNKNLLQSNITSRFHTIIEKQITTENPYCYIFNNKMVGYVIDNQNGTYSVYLKNYELLENDIKISDDYITFDFDFEYDIEEYGQTMQIANIKNYNLNSILFNFVEIAGNETNIIIQTDNSVQEYQDYNSLVPSYVNISNGYILFSRKLTNESIIGNQMSAEVNIPYSVLNRTFSVEQLISQTYKVLSDENKTINKNIYESLYLNFIKHINVIDNNFGKNELQNDISALLTNSIFNLPQKNYSKAPIGYARIFLKNGRNSVISIGQSAITQISQYEYQISIAVNGNNAEKLQILAKDKKTPYVTIPLHAINKVILVKQTLKIEEG